MLRARFNTSRRRPAPGGVSMWQWRTAGTNKKSAGNTRLIFAFSILHCVVLFFLPLSQIENESEDRPENIAFQHHAAAPAEEAYEHIPANNNKSAQMGQQIIAQSQPPIQFENQRQQRQRHEEIDEICAKLVEKSTNAAQRFHFCFNGQHFRMIAQSGKLLPQGSFISPNKGSGRLQYRPPHHQGAKGDESPLVFFDKTHSHSLL